MKPKTMYNQDESTSKRISFQSIFSSLCNLYQGGKYDFSQLEDLSHEVNKRLHEMYPAEVKPIVEYSPTIAQEMFRKETKPVRGKFCPVCQSPMIRQTEKKNPKAPDWKCSNKACKFQKAYDGGWRKSEFITGVWDEPDTKQAEIKNMGQQSQLDVIQQDEYNQQIPPEYR
jgi:hypothetical protein